MKERARPRTVIGRFAPAGPGGMFSAGGADASLVMVAHGHYMENLPVADMSVGEIRRRYRDRFDIDPISQAILDGNEVGDDTAVRSGQALSFIRKSGEKGIAQTRVRGRREREVE